MYFYFVSTINNGFKWKWFYLILFVPFVLGIIDTIIIYTSPKAVYDALLELAITNPIKRFHAKYGLLYLSQHYIIRHIWQFLAVITLFPLMLNFIRSNKSKENAKLILIRWLIILYALMFLMSILTCIHAIERAFDIGILSLLQDNATLINISFYIVLFLIAIIPISFPSILYSNLNITAPNTSIANTVTPPNTSNNSIKEPKYGLNIEDIRSKLDLIIKQDLFSDPNFDLNKCAQELGIPTHQVSHFLKQHMNLSFSSYRNMLRIEKAKRLIKNDYLSLNTIEALALTCGFANRSSFSKVFKKLTDFSPGAYLESLQNNS
ncbi:hypothetical protein APS56_08875 [Pseudalgibacter alginicilyticus]|uniref:HTH araC/xylS-type domain-containing protein n=2 Tax=Pseudalgibacter alginicilyticus TaxID=1736674 RepID=A0A0P0CGC3_9FLAO|nr:hypothetical protein APS56_08875 [Pseudalgibacter alginicilyticus]